MSLESEGWLAQKPSFISQKEISVISLQLTSASPGYWGASKEKLTVRQWDGNWQNRGFSCSTLTGPTQVLKNYTERIHRAVQKKKSIKFEKLEHIFMNRYVQYVYREKNPNTCITKSRRDLKWLAQRMVVMAERDGSVKLAFNAKLTNTQIYWKRNEMPNMNELVDNSALGISGITSDPYGSRTTISITHK